MNYNNYHFKKLLLKPINNLIDEIIKSVHILSPIKNDFYKRNVKYSIKDYVIGIIDVVKNNISWNSYNGIINGNTLRKKHYEFVKLGIYEHAYANSLKKYLKSTKITEELKYQSIDSTFIEELQKNNNFVVIFFRSLRENKKSFYFRRILMDQKVHHIIKFINAEKENHPKELKLLV